MDYESTIKKYIGPSTGLKVVLSIFLALTILLAAMGTISMLGGESEEPQWFNPLYSEGNEYAYLDVVGVTDWLYNYDGSIYYAVEDSEGYTYIAKISDGQFAEMDQQLAYWYRDSGNMPVPDEYRLLGTACSIGDKLKTNLTSVLGLTGQEFDDYLGYMYLDTTTTPSEGSASMFFVLAAFAFLIGLIVAIPYFSSKNFMKRSLAALERSGQLLNASNELGAITNEQVGKKLLLTRSFIFCKHGGFVARYSDVKWLFKRVQRYNFVPVAAYLVVGTDFLNNVSILRTKVKDKEDIGQQVTDRILSANPDVMVGYTPENIKAYNQLFKAAKESRA